MRKKYSSEFISTFTKAKALSPRSYEKHYLAAMKDPSCLHFQLKIGGYPAFYDRDASETLLGNDLLAKNAELTSLFNELTPTAQSLLYASAIAQEVVASLTLEGKKASLQASYASLPNEKSGFSRLGELTSSYLLLASGVRFPCKELSDVRRIYDYLLRGELHQGERPDTPLFRGKECPKDPRFRFSPTSEVKYIVKEALDIASVQNLNIFAKLALFDFFFAYSRPFIKGNGRLIRYLDSSLILPSVLPYMAFFIAQAQARQEGLLMKAYRLTLDERNRADLATFVHVFLSGFSALFDQEIYALRRKKQRAESLRRRYPKESADPLFLLLEEGTVYGLYGYSVYDLAVQLGISERSVSRGLLALKKQGLLLEQSIGKTIHYRLQEK